MKIWQVILNFIYNILLVTAIEIFLSLLLIEVRQLSIADKSINAQSTS